MLALDDPEWSRLTHAYGAATDIPALLKALASSPAPKEYEPEAEPWFTLWSSLCHQGDVYDASYAAVPHLIEIAANAPSPIDSSFLQLPAAIEIARQAGKGPVVPANLEPDYCAALTHLADCVGARCNDSWDDTMTLSALTALAVAKGQYRIAEAIMNLDDYLIQKLIDLDFD